jgi:DNA-damage-inducible protein J
MSNITKTKLIQARLDANLIAEAKTVLDEIGLSLNDAIKVFLKKVVINQGVPFDLTVNKTIVPKNLPIIKYPPEQEKIMDEALEDVKAGRVYSLAPGEDLDAFFEKNF